MNSKDGTEPFEISDTLGYFQSYNNTVGQGHYLFKLNHNKGPICNMFVEATLKITGSATAGTRPLVGKYVGAQILSLIRLRTDDTIFSTINPLYLYGRVDDSNGSKAYTRLLN